MLGLAAQSMEHHNVVITVVITPRPGFPRLPEEYHLCCKRDWNSKTVGVLTAPQSRRPR